MSYEYMDSVYDGRCGTCKYYKFEGQYSKGYCDWYRSYYYPDDSCLHWLENTSVGSSGGCFLTSACCEFKGLSDDCDELTTLRSLRDDYMKDSLFGREMIKIYYDTAPAIVEKIDRMENREDIYNRIYEDITKIVAMVKDKNIDEAVAAYVKMVLWVEKV